MPASLQLPPGDFRAYLFDCDGTIADSMPIHFKAWNSALSEWGCHFELDLFYAWAGIPTPKTVEMLNERFGLKMPVERVVQRKEEDYFKFFPQLQPVHSVMECIQREYGKIPFAVVSGSPRDSVVRTLEALHLLDRFEEIIGAEDYSRGKPGPEPYLLAAERLGVDPKNCLVFEDADLGIQSAEAAGMAWVRIPLSPNDP